MLPLVLPGKVTLHPDVSEPVAATVFRCALLERVEGAFGVGLGGGFLPEKATQVDEVFLGGRTLLEHGDRPLLNELLRRHR